MNEKFLPIGTVVKLKGGTKKIMITSYLVFPNNRNGKSEMFEYGACPYPAGIIDSKYAVGFNHEQIAEIIYLGHVDEEQKEFNKALITTEEKIKEELKKAEEWS